ncbi:inner centromere protein A-like isoform X2 [Rhineura floridana]|uniref:inner centromere protein A-like isoform X2 n=1 Tax=Rhineura floridana TaxID=261503 RepID=UPI002AC82A7D|nr:inner centromere protein A-like isoform X2 [Rhineura floridana]
MAEARGPAHLLDVCGQKFSEFLFNAEHKCLVWLREIEEEALKMFDSNFSAEPELMPKTPSQKKHRKKKRSSSFKDENKELTRKRLSRRRSSVKAASSQYLCSSEEELKNLDVGMAISISGFMTCSVAEQTSEVQYDKLTMDPTGGGATVPACSQNSEFAEKQNEGMNGVPEIITVCSDDCSVDRAGATEASFVANSPALTLKDIIDPTGKDAARSMSTSTPKASLNGKPTHGDEFPAQKLVTNLVPEGELSQESKVSTGATSGSQSGHHPPNRSHKNRRVSLAEKYSLTNKRKSMIRKSIRKSIAKKKAAWDSLTTSSQVSCHSSIEVFMDDEANKDGPFLVQNAESGEALNTPQNMPCALDAPSLNVCVAVQSPIQLKMQQGEVCSKERLETKITDTQVCGSENSALNNCPHEELQNIRRQSYEQAVDELPAAQHGRGKSPSRLKAPSSTADKLLPSSGPGKIAQPFKNFFQTIQKSQLLKSPGSSGHSSVMKNLIKRGTSTKAASKGDFVEKERQRLESLRKKQEAEQQRKQKVEEEKRRRLEEIKLKREERLRKTLQARERMEEEKKKRIGQKFCQHEERNEKVREEKISEEKTKKKISTKKMGETEARKQKEEACNLQEQPEKWKTVGEIKKMLEHNCAKQGKGHQGQQVKEKWARSLELAVVTEEEENLKDEQNSTRLEELQQAKKAMQVDTLPAANKWLNITAQKSPVDSSNQVNSQGLKDNKSLKVNLNDYGMDLNSDDSTDDESQPRKPIPPWANGLQLNEAVTYQYYNPPDINKFFGLILSPKLEDIFYKSKPRYFKRTSSAVWHSPPLPGTKAALRASNSMKKY